MIRAGYEAGTSQFIGGSNRIWNATHDHQVSRGLIECLARGFLVARGRNFFDLKFRFAALGQSLDQSRDCTAFCNHLIGPVGERLAPAIGAKLDACIPRVNWLCAHRPRPRLIRVCAT